MTGPQLKLVKTRFVLIALGLVAIALATGLHKLIR